MARFISESTSIEVIGDHVEALVVDPRQGLGDDLAQRLVEPRRTRISMLGRRCRTSWPAHACTLSTGCVQSKTGFARFERLNSAIPLVVATISTASHSFSAASPRGIEAITGPKKLASSD